MSAASRLVLASASRTRYDLLIAAGLAVVSSPVRLDEAAIRDALQAQAMAPRDIAGELADLKACRAAGRYPSDWIIAADQILELDGQILGKPDSLDGARNQLCSLSGKTHALHTAVIVHEAGQPVWRHVDTSRLTFRALTSEEIHAYLDKIGLDALETPGSYRIEGLGIRLFQRIDGDHFAILGLPLLPLLGYLRQRQVIV
jgi:septum formation protein